MHLRCGPRRSLVQLVSRSVTLDHMAGCHNDDLTTTDHNDYNDYGHKQNTVTCCLAGGAACLCTVYDCLADSVRLTVSQPANQPARPWVRRRGGGGGGGDGGDDDDDGDIVIGNDHHTSKQRCSLCTHTRMHAYTPRTRTRTQPVKKK